MTATTATRPPYAHDHAACARDALARAEEICAGRGARLTPVRRRVLEIVWGGHRPIGAYAILEELDRTGGGRTAPLTVYRALDFLQTHGLVHRIESLNAFVGCADPGDPHAGQFLVCERCGDATELDDPEVDAAIRAAAARRGFAVARPTVEVSGTCPRCAAAPPSCPSPTAPETEDAA